MQSYKERKIDLTKPVTVHRNLHLKNYSIKQGGIVVAHTNNLILTACKFLVSKAGQARVRATKQKNVHAYIKGIIVDEFEGIIPEKGIALPAQIRYNPYVDDTFTSQKIGELPKAILTAPVVMINSRGVTTKC